jgi:flavin-dependent dehydrogenase
MDKKGLVLRGTMSRPGFHEENYIELYFFRKTIPGYLWVFPLADQKANVGIGMLSSFISKKKINLKEALDELISTHPMLKARFAHARALESVKGFNLPLASRKRKISGDRYLLLGDAASLIDPLSGEGIGNAIRSGRVAAMHIIQHLGQGDFSAKTNQLYDAEIYRRMWKELQFSARLQRILRYPRLLDFVIKKAKASPRIQQTLRNIMDDIHQQNNSSVRNFWNCHKVKVSIDSSPLHLSLDSSLDSYDCPAHLDIANAIIL